MRSCIGLGRVRSKFFPLVVGWDGLGQSADGLGWIGSHKIDPTTTLGYAVRKEVVRRRAADERRHDHDGHLQRLDLGSTVSRCLPPLHALPVFTGMQVLSAVM